MHVTDALKRALNTCLGSVAICLVAACGSAVPVDRSPLAGLCPNRAAAPGADRFDRTVELISTTSGLRYGDIAPGCGALALPGQQVTIQYTAWLADGREFDTSRQPGRGAFTFTPGSNGALPGFSYSFTDMRVGGYRRLVIPPALAFGSTGVPPVIPPDATIVVDIQLVAVSCNPTAANPTAPC
jgi:hypothetical protein